MLAHEEAAEHYGRALEVLDRFGPEDDDRRRGELLLLQGEALVRAGEPVAGLAGLRGCGALGERPRATATLVARAAVAASPRYLQQPGVVDAELIELLERALELTRGERSVMRVMLLARLCGALYFSPGARAHERAGRRGGPDRRRARRPRGRGVRARARAGAPCGIPPTSTSA